MRFPSRFGRPAAVPLCVAGLALLAAAPVRADLLVDEDLGTLGFGTVSRSGDTLTSGNEAGNYINANDALLWNGEDVYQFSVATRGTLDLTSTDDDGGPSGVDNDFFLLTGLTTAANDDPGGIGPEAVDVFGGESGPIIFTGGTFGLIEAGTYFLSVDAFEGSVDLLGAGGGAYAFDLIFSEFVVPDAPDAVMTDLGGTLEAALGAAEVLFYEFEFDGVVGRILDTFGTTFDTELGLFDAEGFLLGANDDSGGTLQSALNLDDFGLTAGETYYLAAGAFNTMFSDGFGATSTSTASGTLMINGLSVAAVPEPGTLALLGGPPGWGC